MWDRSGRELRPERRLISQGDRLTDCYGRECMIPTAEVHHAGAPLRRPYNTHRGKLRGLRVQGSLKLGSMMPLLHQLCPYLSCMEECGWPTPISGSWNRVEQQL